VKGLAKLQALSDRTVDELLTILAKAPLSFRGDDLLSFVRGKFQEDKEVLDETFPLLLSLTALRLRLDMDAVNLSEVVCEAINEGEYPELLMSDQDQESFLQRLTKLLAVEALLYPVKAPDIMSAYEHVFAYARIVSDIRPLFGSDITVQPPAAAIVHTLQLTCHQADGVRDYFIAMDEDDLLSLGEVVDRALVKARSLGSLLRKTEIKVVGEGESS
jgi:hypothetical protein